MENVITEKPAIRIDLEHYVIAWNTCLRERVGSMSVIELLRNANPTYVPSFAAKLVEAKLLSKDEAHEFVKVIGGAYKY